MNVLMLSIADYIYHFHGNVEIIFNYIKLVLAGPVLLLLGLPILNSALRSFPNIRFNIDALIIIGTFSTFLISTYSVLTGQDQVYFDTVTMLLVLLTLGRYIEANAKASNTNAIRGLLDLTPKTAIVLKNGIEKRVDSDSIEKYDLVKIMPGESLPVDGEVIEGQSSVDESSLTGESVPVFKEIGSTVYSGTINLDGSLILKAQEVGDNKTISRLVRLLEEARQNRAPIERIADKITSIFVPLVIIVSVMVFSFWVIRSGVNTALLNSLSILVISCPCALGIATPLALWTALGRAARAGVLIRSGSLMEKLSYIDTVFFDKTGTLTKRELKLDTIFVDPECNINESEVITMSASLESGYDHPLARSIIAYAMENKIWFPPVDNINTEPGLGIKGTVNGKCVYAGSYRFMQSYRLKISESISDSLIELESLGMTPMFLGLNNEVIAVLGFREALREESATVIKELKNMGIHNVILTGDNKYAAGQLSAILNIESKSELLPQDKVEIIKGYTSRGFTVAMVGDGINDAPALNAADVGIVLGCGSDITRESADISLLSDDLTKVPWIINLSKKTYRIIKQNLFWAFFYNSIGICIAALGLLQPVLAAIAMLISSFIVLGNSLRIENINIGYPLNFSKHKVQNMSIYENLGRTLF